MVAAAFVCAAEALAPTDAHARDVMPVCASGAPITRGFAEPQPRRSCEQERAEAVAGGKLLLSKRLKLIIKYHQVIPA